MNTVYGQPEPYLAIASYETSQYELGVPEKRLGRFLTWLGVDCSVIGAGISLDTGERDVEMYFIATPLELTLIQGYLGHSMQDVWEIVEEEDA